MTESNSQLESIVAATRQLGYQVTHGSRIAGKQLDSNATTKPRRKKRSITPTPTIVPPELEITRDTPAPHHRKATIYVDGSCPANPGLMGIGFVITIEDEKDNIDFPITLKYGYRLWDGTNNQAEFHAVIQALKECIKYYVTDVILYTDSMIAAKSINNNWKPNKIKLKQLNAEAQALRDLFSSFTINHIPRELNSIADDLSRNPQEPEIPAAIHVVNIGRRLISDQHAALIRWWYLTHRCTSVNLLKRLFPIDRPALRKIQMVESYKHLTIHDLPGSNHRVTFQGSPTVVDHYKKQAELRRLRAIENKRKAKEYWENYNADRD